jgi:hypothetical protein
VLSRPGRYRFASGQPGDAAVGMAGSFRVGVGGKARPLATSSLLRLSTIATGLGPLTFAVAPPGDPHRLFVVRQDGLVLLFKDGVKEDRPFPWREPGPRSSPTGSATRGGSRSTPRRRRTNLRALDGLYLWADFCEGRVNALTAAGNVVPLSVRAEQPTSFGLDGTGRVYVTTATGTLLRLDIGDRP